MSTKKKKPTPAQAKQPAVPQDACVRGPINADNLHNLLTVKNGRLVRKDIGAPAFLIGFEGKTVNVVLRDDLLEKMAYHENLAREYEKLRQAHAEISKENQQLLNYNTKLVEQVDSLKSQLEDAKRDAQYVHGRVDGLGQALRKLGEGLRA